jgi:hypothetical protein
MSISFKFKNTLSQDSHIYPLLDLPEEITLYQTDKTKYESRDLMLNITIILKDDFYCMAVNFLNILNEPYERRHNNYDDCFMESLYELESSYRDNSGYLNIDSPHRFHPLYQLLGLYNINYYGTLIVWKDYTLLTAINSMNRNKIIIIIRDYKVIYQSEKDKNASEILTELMKELDSGSALELLEIPIERIKSARK